MFRLDNILERWAIIYKPLSHSNDRTVQHKAFYRIDTINNNNEFVQAYNIAPSPGMAYSTLIDARLQPNGKHISYRHSIYFMVKQAPPANSSKTIVNDALEATEAKYDADELVQDLLAFLFELRNEVLNHTGKRESDTVKTIADSLSSDQRQGIIGLQIDRAEWGTMPMRFNGWWICGLEIEQLAPRNLCVNEEKYKQ